MKKEAATKKGADKFTGIVFSREGGPKKTESHILEDPQVIGSRIAVREIDLSLIDPNPEQPRKVFDDVTLKSLSDSIKNKGILQPIILVREGNRYGIVTGERRWKASSLAGLKTIPAIVRDAVTDKEEISLIENIQREDLSPIEECTAIKNILDSKRYLQKEMAAIINRDEPYISKAIKIAHFAEKHGNINRLASLKINDGTKLTMAHWVLISSRSSFEEGVKVLNDIIGKQLSYRQTKRNIEGTKRSKDITWNNKRAIGRLKSIRRTLQLDFLDSVSVNNVPDKGLYKKELESTLEHLRSAESKVENTLKSIESS